MSMNSKGSMNYSCLIFSLPAVSCNLICFFCTDACASRDASQSKQRKAANHTLLESLPLKNKLAQVSDTIEACYHNDQTETRKITNAYEVFFLSELACQRHNALSLNGAGLISQSTANFSDVTVQPLQSLLNSVGGVESILSIFGIPDLSISHGLFPY